MRYLIIVTSLIFLTSCAITSSQKFDRCVEFNNKVCDDFYNMLPSETPAHVNYNCRERAIDWCTARYLDNDDSFHPSLRDF